MCLNTVGMTVTGLAPHGHHPRPVYCGPQHLSCPDHVLGPVSSLLLIPAVTYALPGIPGFGAVCSWPRLPFHPHPSCCLSHRALFTWSYVVRVPECTALLLPWGLGSLLHFHLESPPHLTWTALQPSGLSSLPLKTLKLIPIKTVLIKYIEDPNTGALDSCLKK